MSAFISAAILTIGGSLISNSIAQSKQEKAQKRAEEQAAADAAQARKAEVFAKTEGEGLGDLAEISLEIDDTVDEEEEALRQGSLRV